MFLSILAACSEHGLAPRDGPPTPGAPAAEGAGEPAPPEELPANEGDPAPPGAVIFDDTKIHRFDLLLSKDAEHALRSDPDVDVPATFRFGGEEWLVGLRIKGSYSRRGLSQKAAFKIDFGELVPDAELHGLRRLTLNNMVQDGSMIREHVIYRAYAAAGVPAPRHAYAELWVNDELWGVYGVLDAMDRRFARWAYPEDGEGWLYEGGDGADLLPGREDRFVVQATGEGEPYRDLETFVADLEAVDDVAELLDRLDPSVFRMWATDLLSGNRDGYTRRRNNYLLYHGADRWWFVPWGNDQALRDGFDVYDGYMGRLLLDCDDSDVCRKRLEAAVSEVAATWEAMDIVGYADTTGLRIAEACERDPRREDACGHDSVVEFLGGRLAEVRGD